jgi:hypothetical protein
MSRQLSVKAVVCSEYQTLLEECQSALEIWNEYRAEIDQDHSIGKDAGDELLRLQARYARAYTVLQNHTHNCFRCESIARIRGSDSKNDWGALSENNVNVCARAVTEM